MPTELLRIRKRDGSSNYQLQLAVPADLRQHFNGSRYIRLSLGTGDKALAREKARSVALPYWQKFCDLRELPQAQAHSLNQEQFLAESLAYLKDRASAESRRIAQLIAEGEEEARAFAEQSWDAAHDSLWDDINPEGGNPRTRQGSHEAAAEGRQLSPVSVVSQASRHPSRRLRRALVPRAQGATRSASRTALRIPQVETHGPDKASWQGDRRGPVGRRNWAYARRRECRSQELHARRQVSTR